MTREEFEAMRLGAIVRTPTGRQARVIRIHADRGEVDVERVDDGELVSLSRRWLATAEPSADACETTGGHGQSLEPSR